MKLILTFIQFSTGHANDKKKASVIRKYILQRISLSQPRYSTYFFFLIILDFQKWIFTFQTLEILHAT